MRRKLPLLVLLFPWFIFPAFGQFVNLTASNIKDGSGALLSSGSLCVRPVNNSNMPLLSAAAGSGGGSLTTNEVCTPVTDGALPGVWWASDPTAGGTNLVPDPVILSGFSTWSNPGTGWSIATGAGYTGTDALEVSPSAAANGNSASAAITVQSGLTYTFGGYIDATHVSSLTPQWVVENYATGAVLVALPQTAGTAGWLQAQFVMPASVTQVKIVAGNVNAVVASGQVLKFSAPLLQPGFSQVADTSLTSPPNLCYRFTVRNAQGLAISTTPCAQPSNATANAGAQAYWCSTASGLTKCNFDAFIPPSSPLVVATQGPTGPTGPAGPAPNLTIGTVSSGSAAASITGTTPNFVLNLTLPVAGGALPLTGGTLTGALETSGVGSGIFTANAPAGNQGADTVSAVGLFSNNLTLNQISAPPPNTFTLAAGSAGNPNGIYNYAIKYLTAAGQSNPSGVIAVTVANQQVVISNIPIGPAGTTGRVIYRNAAGSDFSQQQYVATIADNTTTTYTDNTADGSLGYTMAWRSPLDGAITYGGSTVLWAGSQEWVSGQNNLPSGTCYFAIAIGINVLNNCTTGYRIVGVGGDVFNLVTTGIWDTGVGVHCESATATNVSYNNCFGGLAGEEDQGNNNDWNGYSSGTFNQGSWNCGFGNYTLTYNQGGYNCGFAPYALYHNLTGIQNLAAGYGNSYTNTTGSSIADFGFEGLYNNNGGSNTGLGAFNCWSATNKNSSICLGFKSGYYLTANGELIIDNAPRTSAADEQANAIVYGVMSPSGAPSQTLALNAAVSTPVSFSTPALYLNGSAILSSVSSANPQIVTCPPGGSGTQVCTASGAWLSYSNLGQSPGWLQWLGTGADGANTTASGNICGEKFYTNFTVPYGNTVTCNSSVGLVIHATGACIVAGTINARGVDTGNSLGVCGSGGGGSGGGSSAGSVGGAFTIAGVSISGGTAGASSGGAGGAGAAAQTNNERACLNGQGGTDGLYWGGGNGKAGYGASSGAGGIGGVGVTLICGSFTGTDGTHTGTIDVSGGYGGTPTANSNGAGSGGGASSVIISSLATVTTFPNIYYAGGAGGLATVPEVVAQGGSCTTQPQATCGVTSGAFSGTCTVVTAGAGCGTGADITWEIVGGGGTPGTAVFNPTWSGGALASATMTPGTSSGYTSATYTTSGAGGQGGSGWTMSISGW